jgi:hypothetical protein
MDDICVCPFRPDRLRTRELASGTVSAADDAASVTDARGVLRESKCAFHQPGVLPHSCPSVGRFVWTGSEYALGAASKQRPGSVLPPGDGPHDIEASFTTMPEYPGCPGCGSDGFVRCGRCKQLGCWDDGWETFHCPRCGKFRAGERHHRLAVGPRYRLMRTVSGLHGSYRVTDGPLSKGGVGSIFRTSDPSIVYKEYHSLDKAPPREPLDVLVEIGRDVIVNHGLGPGDAPESSVNWPLDIVPDRQGRIVGVTLPAIPAALFNENKKPRTLDFLVGALRTWLAERWARPAMAWAVGDSLRYRRQGSHDDRTAVVVWTEPSDPS